MGSWSFLEVRRQLVGSTCTNSLSFLTFPFFSSFIFTLVITPSLLSHIILIHPFIITTSLSSFFLSLSLPLFLRTPLKIGETHGGHSGKRVVVVVVVSDPWKKASFFLFPSLFPSGSRRRAILGKLCLLRGMLSGSRTLHLDLVYLHPSLCRVLCLCSRNV